MRQKSVTGLTYTQALGYTFFRFVYGVRYHGFEQAADLKGPIVYLVSTQSRLDRRLLKTFLPLGTFHVRLDDNPAQYLTLIKSVLAGRGRVCLYGPKEVEPSAEVLELLNRAGVVFRDTGARILPIFVRGTRTSLFSLWDRNRAPRSLLPQILVTAAPAYVLGDSNDSHLVDQLLDGMASAKFRSVNLSQTLFEALSGAARQFGASRQMLEDALGGKLSYSQLLVGARLLATRFAALSRKGEAMGVLLPNSNGVVLTTVGLLSAGRPAALLNYTAGPGAVVSAINIAAIRIVISSRAFVEKAGLEELVRSMTENGTSLVYLEDIRKDIDFIEKVRAWLHRRKPVTPTQAEDAAVILFTSGSEGMPKGVVLSSRNLIANAAQAECRVDISPVDSLFNVLPLFHSFGILGGMVLPLLYGIRLFLYPSPLHYKLVPSVARKAKPTVMFGTDTFLMGYGRAAKDGDFDSVRLIVAGAEAVKPETRKIFRERFTAEIVEGYGMTEASPVVAVNSSCFSKDGSVGRLLPGMEMRLEPVEGIEGAGRLFIAGPNVMQGYMLADAPGALQPIGGKWHDTGDIVSVDERGFITIRGRVKRFAKIAGEMVSLGAVEIMVQKLWPEGRHAVISVPDTRRGERIVLVTTQQPAQRQELIAYSKRYGASELMLPDDIVHVAEIPVLGSGKVNYAETARLVSALPSM
ncbi:AMP-binding protein [Rhizobium sp. KVB221]|uniref:AMP-binding protein n=2 Tax=Rhizobium setariae TaxID=2801340 RepID=A0A936YMY1_9HYPH|nr:AMP-binding protein [Rhizobium setariae]MBL0371201.1 AMP-binding protein [Rhizobium setariae]